MQYTRRLSIRIECGCHFTACWQGVSGSSFFVDLPVGRMLQNVFKTFRGYVVGPSRRCQTIVLGSPFRTKETGGQVASPVSLARFVGQSIHSPSRHRSQMGGSAWPQVPIEAAGLLAGPTQTGVLEAHEA